MFRTLLRSPRTLPRTVNRAATASRPSLLHSAAFFTASVGVGACPKRRNKQSNEESGEDAYFVNKTSDRVSSGVFDGVGGWADSGVDPSIFSSGLAKHCAAVSSSDPAVVLQQGYDGLQGDVCVEMGSSTACVATLSLSSAKLAVANLGDSGFLIVDVSGKITYESQPQIYFFNAPYQLAKMPDSMRKPNRLENKPADADVTTHDLSAGGFVILGTDGFFDNVFAAETENLVKSVLTQGKKGMQATVDGIAQVLVQEAKVNGRSRTKNGPFAAEALQHRMRFVGGKEDDIVVIVIGINKDDLSTKAKL